MVIVSECFSERIFVVFGTKTSLGLKFCNNLSMYSAFPCAVRNSPVETSKNEIPIFLLVKYIEAKNYWFWTATPHRS